ncbi:hypothetical protein GA0115252_150934 [Streptomyces sp. DfronAA-171]|nr:hypothetical protein GA0115252_150934 [Streptomyces sp. DfronAA-171]
MTGPHPAPTPHAGHATPHAGHATPNAPPRQPQQQFPHLGPSDAVRHLVRGRVEKAEDRVDRRAGRRLVRRGADLAEGVHPEFDVLALEAAHPAAVLVAEAVELPVVEDDQGAVVEGEVDVAGEERVEYRFRGSLGRREARASAREQALADADEQFGEHRVLAREVAVEAGAADAHGRAYLVHPDPVEAARGEEAGGLPEDLDPSCRRVCARGAGAHGKSF